MREQDPPDVPAGCALGTAPGDLATSLDSLMTIGIAAYGPNAGQAIIDALRAAEVVGHGAISGFVSMVVIGEDGELHRIETQRGGTQGLLKGGEMPTHFMRARHAALMSSGPDRPSPLAQFTPGMRGPVSSRGTGCPTPSERRGSP